MLRRRGSLSLLIAAIAACPGIAAPQEVAPPAGRRSISQVGVSPSIQQLTEAEALRTNSFRLHNFGSNSVRARIEIVPFTLDADSELVLLPSTATSIDQWVVVNPTEFEVQPGKAQTVRFSVRPAVPLEPGEHRFLMVFHEVLDTGSTASGMRARFELRCGVYVQVGEARRTAEISSFEGGPDGVSFTVRVDGTAHARFDADLVVWPRERWPGAEATTRPTREAGQPLLPEGAVEALVMPGTPVLPGNTQLIRIDLREPLDPGEYTADLNGSLGDTGVDRGFHFKVPSSE